jgi:hypothetical protein
MKWNQWGHTFRDIAMDSAISTAWPFNILRSLAIWKPRTRNWGYDLLMSAALRAANRQNGMEIEDLETFIDLKMNRLFHIPMWLQGSVADEDGDAWPMYIQETLDNSFQFLQTVNAVTVLVHLTLALIITLVTTSRSSTRQLLGLNSVIFRLTVSHGLVAFFTWAALTRIETSPWGSNIRKGLTFRRPFPTMPEFTSVRWETDPTVPVGPTTLPERMDVLWGTRYDAPYLGSYNQWLDYHPGNRILKASIASRAPLYPMYNTNEKYHSPVILLQRLIQDIVDEVAKQTDGGRFLRQDHRSGDWVVLEMADAMEMIRRALATESNMVLKNVNQQIDYLVADFRFAAHRGTALAIESTLYLEELRKQILQTTNSLLPVPRHTSSPIATTVKKQSHLGPLRPILQQPKTAPKLTSSPSRVPSASSNSRRATSDDQPTVGTLVMVFDSIANGWFKATIAAVVRERSKFDVIYAYDGTYEENVDMRRIRKRVPLQENLRVEAVLDDDLPYQGTINMVCASGKVDILFDDGEVLQNVAREDVTIHYPTW